MSIQPTTPTSSLPPKTRPRLAGAAGFSVPDQGDQSTDVSVVSQINVAWALSLQEVEPPADRNRQSRRGGARLLDLLTQLQRSVLQPADDAHASLAEIETTLARLPVATDPVLKSLIDAIVLRARVELARPRR